MNPALTAVAVAVGAGAVVAVSSRDPRAALIGLSIVLGGAPFLVDPLPGPAALAVRVVGGLLCVSIVRLAMPGQGSDPGLDAASPLGWPAEALFALGAAAGGGAIAIGLVAVGGGGVPGADVSASAASSMTILITAVAAAVFAVGATPAVVGGAGVRRAIGVVLVAVAVTLLRIAFAGAPNEFEQVAIAVLLVGCGVGAVAIGQAAVPRTPTADASRGEAR